MSVRQHIEQLEFLTVVRPRIQHTVSGQDVLRRLAEHEDSIGGEIEGIIVFGDLQTPRNFSTDSIIVCAGDIEEWQDGGEAQVLGELRKSPDEQNWHLA